MTGNVTTPITESGFFTRTGHIVGREYHYGRGIDGVLVPRGATYRVIACSEDGHFVRVLGDDGREITHCTQVGKGCLVQPER